MLCCTDQQPHPQPLLLLLPQREFPHPPPQKSSRMIIQQQLSPHPLPEKPMPLPHPQQDSRRISQIQENPFVPSHPHPQFVAAKSLISFSSEISITVYHMRGCRRCYCFLKNSENSFEANPPQAVKDTLEKAFCVIDPVICRTLY